MTKISSLKRGGNSYTKNIRYLSNVIKNIDVMDGHDAILDGMSEISKINLQRLSMDLKEFDESLQV